MVRRNLEARFSPLAQGRNFVGDTGEAKIQLAAANGRLTGITFRPKFQHHPIAKSSRQWQVSLQRDPFLCAPRENPQSRATVELRPSAATSARDLNDCSPAKIDQCSAARVGRRKRGDCRIFMNRRAEFAGALEQEFIEQAALDRDLRVSPPGSSARNRPPSIPMNSTRSSFAVRQSPKAFRQFQSPQNRPTRGIHTIAADFFPRKHLAFQEQRSQAGAIAQKAAQLDPAGPPPTIATSNMRYCRGKNGTSQGCSRGPVGRVRGA